MRMPSVYSTLLACALLLGIPLLLPAQQASPMRETVERGLGADRFVAGGVVTVAKPVAGDLFAAGGNIDVDAAVAGDALVAGGNVRLGAPVGQNLYAAGGRVSVNGTVQRNARLAGGHVEIGPRAKIAGNVSVGGGEARIGGAIGGYLQVGGGRVFIDGPIGGDVEAGSAEIELGPGARISGTLRYASRDELRRDPAAQVLGGIERLAPRAAWPVPSVRERARHRIAWLWSAGLIVLAAALAAALPGVYSGVAAAVRTHWARSLLVGFIALVCIPVGALLAMLTVIGIPLALAVLALYLALLVVGYASAGVSVGELALQRWQPARASRRGWRVVAAALGMLAISLLGGIPWIGGLVVSAAMLLGIGALLSQLQPESKS
jgi:hypothetical protein